MFFSPFLSLAALLFSPKKKCRCPSSSYFFGLSCRHPFLSASYSGTLLLFFSHTPALGRPLPVAGLLHCFLHCFFIIGWLVVGMDSIKRQIGKAFSAHVFATRVVLTVKCFTDIN